jgi:excisionase family DNA binding protein
MRLSRKLRRKYFYTVEQAGKQVGYSRAEAYRAVWRHEIPTERDGRLLLVPRAIWDHMREQILRGKFPKMRKVSLEKATGPEVTV